MSGTPRVRLSSAVAVGLDGRTLAGRELGSRKARTLLALLAAERGRLVPLDRIVEVLWAEEPPADPAANVSTLVSRTRRLLGDRVLVASGRAYGLGDGSAWTVDLDEAAALLAESAARLSAGEPALAEAGSREALALLGDQPALVDEPDADWVLAVRRETDGLRRQARHLLAAALTSVGSAAGAEVAAEAVEADPYDERAARDLMRALVAAGRPTAALEAYDALVRRLRAELGTDPASATADLHVAILREAAAPAEDDGARRPAARSVLLGRDAELALVERAWAAASEHSGGLVVVEGEAGIGKTRVLEAVAAVARGTGGLVLTGRCHPTERSLFLEPFVEALRPVLLDQPTAALATLLHGHEPAWLALLPEVASVLPTVQTPDEPPDLQRRRAYDAVAAVLRRLARDRPVLLALDDLQDGGAATVDLLGHLASRLAGQRVLLLGAVRTEATETRERLASRGTPVHLGALPRSAVDALAGAAGLAGRGAALMERTAGHPLSVVESLRALAAGDTGVPTSLTAAVLARVARLPAEQQDLVRAASVLRRRLEPRLLADLTETSELVAVRGCESLALAGLLVRSGRDYEFANDLLQECVHASLPPALATAYHRRAADLTSDRPESMAEHAFAAGELDRAARGWLLAAESAMATGATDDAAALCVRGLDATDDPVTRARLLLARASTLEARTTYAAGLADIDEALDLARRAGDRRLELAALRARGGDLAVGLRLPSGDVAAPLEAALLISAELGDRPAEADLSARLAVIDVSRLRFSSALARVERTLHRLGSGRPEVRVLALDGLKTPLAYLGDADRLHEVLAELEPMLRRRESSWLLQWVVFESSFVEAAHGRWDACREKVAEAGHLNRRSGFPAYAGFFEAFLGWFERLAGDPVAAERHGRRSVELTSDSDHPWWYAAACGQLAATLIESGDTVEAEALARRGLAATGPGTAEAWRLRCAAPLAAVSDSDEDWQRAAGLLHGIDAPPGQAWVAGADCYLLVGRAALRRGTLSEVAAPLAALREATATFWAPVRSAVDALTSQTSSASS